MSGGTQEIEPGVVTLRAGVQLKPLAMEHAARMYEWMCDPEVRLNVGVRREPSMEATLGWLNRALDDASLRPFAIVADGDHIGNVVLDRIDPEVSTARISIYIGRQINRRAGVGRTALFLAVREGFDRLGLNKIWATVHCFNYVSLNAFARLGFAVEGILREEFLLAGRRVDAFYLGLLRKDLESINVMWIG